MHYSINMTKNLKNYLLWLSKLDKIIFLVRPSREWGIKSYTSRKEETSIVSRHGVRSKPDKQTNIIHYKNQATKFLISSSSSTKESKIPIVKVQSITQRVIVKTKPPLPVGSGCHLLLDLRPNTADEAPDLPLPTHHSRAGAESGHRHLNPKVKNEGRNWEGKKVIFILEGFERNRERERYRQLNLVCFGYHVLLEATSDFKWIKILKWGKMHVWLLLSFYSTYEF